MTKSISRKIIRKSGNYYENAIGVNKNNTRASSKTLHSRYGLGIRGLRINMHIGQRELSDLAHVPINELQLCERGLILPNEQFFKAVGKILGVSSKKLIKQHKKIYKNPISGEGYVTRFNNEMFIIKPKKNPKKHTKKVLDLFCGIGGFSYGFEQTKKFDVIGGLDLLPDRIQTFARNHKKAMTFCADITKFPITELKKNKLIADVIIGGPPCQGFSSIRPFRSFNEHDKRNTLFEYFVKTVNYLKPEWFVLENVVGLLTHQNGRTFSTLKSLFESSGYTISWKVLNAVHYGLPQRRERLIIVGNRNKKKFIFPAPTHFYNGRSMIRMEHRETTNKNLKNAVTVIDAIGDLPILKSGDEKVNYPSKNKNSDYSRKLKGNNKILTLHKSTMHSDRLLKIIKHSGSNINHIPKGMVKGFSTSYSRLDPNQPAVTLTVNFTFPGSNKCIHPFQNRALTPREGARLQGFDDRYEFIGSKTQIVKQIGNAVPPLLGRIIAEEILKQSR